MRRWYFALATLVVISSPLAATAQNGFGGGSSTSGGSGFGGGGSAGSSSTSGQMNTTLLGNTVNLNFNSVFGTSATLANTNTDPFASYRPTGSGTGSTTGVGSAFSGGTGGTGSATGSRTSTGLGGGLGTTAGGLGTGGGARATGLGTAGGGLGGGTLGGGLGGQRNTLGGGGAGALGGQRNMMGGNMGFLGGGGAMGFLGGGMNNQQNATPALGYSVNFEGKNSGPGAVAVGSTLTNNVELQQRLAASPGMQNAANLQIFMQGETAILRGQVASDYAKTLAAAMVRLEPGVYSVENQLVVAPPRK